MNRRKFIRNIGTAAVGASLAPYILPSGRLFAQTGSQMAKHVVYVMFAGGVRQQESILKDYLAQSQGLSNIGGNIMPNMFNGSAPQEKVVYGQDVPGNPKGEAPISPILANTIQSQGTIFSEVESINPGHYAGLNTLLTGNGQRAQIQGLKVKPNAPTIFEYARKHIGLKATDTWFVGNGTGNSIPLLNFSEHPDYGGEFGGNFICPSVIFGNRGRKHLSDAKIYHPEEELSHIYQMKYFLDNNFNGDFSELLKYSMFNSEPEKQEIKQFFKDMFLKSQAGQIEFPPVNDTADTLAVGWAIEIIKRFQPAITVLNMGSVDTCHGDYTAYLRALHRADHALGFLWNRIQSIPEMANDTVMIVIPEHGRNLNPNPILDENNWQGFDHSDANTRRIWAAMVGKDVPSNLMINPTGGNSFNGTSMDAALTIGEILGFKQDMLNAGLIGGDRLSYFDRI